MGLFQKFWCWEFESNSIAYWNIIRRYDMTWRVLNSWNQKLENSIISVSGIIFIFSIISISSTSFVSKNLKSFVKMPYQED